MNIDKYFETRGVHFNPKGTRIFYIRAIKELSMYNVLVSLDKIGRTYA